MRGPQFRKGAVLWLKVSFLLCKHSSYWVTNYLTQTNRCLIWFQVFNCTATKIHYTPLTAAFGLSQLCLQVQSLHYSFQIDVQLLQIQRVPFFCRAAHIVQCNHYFFSFSATKFILIKSYKQIGVIHGKCKEKWVIPVPLTERIPDLLGIWCW